MHVAWNLLYGFPGELDEDYQLQIELIKKIPHLQAPAGVGRIRMDRFSPNFNATAETHVKEETYLSLDDKYFNLSLPWAKNWIHKELAAYEAS